MTITDLLGHDNADTFGLGDEQDWMRDPRRPCAVTRDNPAKDTRKHADTWFPGDKHYDQATTLCDACPTRTRNACLQYALDNDEEHGIFGGTTPAQRAVMKGMDAPAWVVA